MAGKARAARSHLPQLFDHLVQTQALDELHDVIGRAVVLADAEDRHDVRVVELGGSLGLALEPQPLLVVADHLGRQDLQCHMAAERNLLGLVDHAHPAMADLADDPEIADLLG